MPRIKSKQIDATIPINPTDVATKGYVDILVATTSGNTITSNLSIKDEGVVISTGVTTINFIGTEVYSRRNIVTNDIDVFIPSIIFTANLSGLTSNFTTYQRNISHPIQENNPFNIGNWNTGLHSTVNTLSDVSYTSNVFGFTNQNTYILASIYLITGNTNTEVLLAQSSASTYGNSNDINNYIEIRLNSFATESTKYINIIDSIKFYLQYLIPNGGRFRIKIDLYDDIYTFHYVETDIFYDTNYYFNETYGFNITGLTIVESPTNVITKWISGVEYYVSGSSFLVNLSSITYPNYLTYPNTLIVIDGSEYNLSTLNITNLQLNNWTNYFNSNTNIYYRNTAWNISSNRFYTLTTTANVKAHSVDWYNNTDITSNVTKVAIDTLNDISDRNTEDFANEIFRLTSSLTTWDSTQSLNTYDSGGGLQLYNSRLYYPNIMYYTVYNPNPLTQPDYSNSVGPKSYYRKFVGSAFSSNGVILFTDHNLLESDVNQGINSNILVQISIDSGLTWYSVNDELISFPLNDGDGCRTNINTYNIDLNSKMQFSLGTYSSDNFIIKIIYKDNPTTRTKYIGGIDIVEGNWV
jgi:hypothetical protein